MKKDRDIVTITPAMINGSKLEEIFKEFPNRSIDTGITESFATTLACAISLNDKKVFLPIYSSFLQRAYDNINHDIARMNTHVIIGVRHTMSRTQDALQQRSSLQLFRLLRPDCSAISSLTFSSGMTSSGFRSISLMM